MRFGYMSGFRADLISEIEFSKKYFDFTEITIQPELLKTIDDIFFELKKAIHGFEVLGHIHWDITNFDAIAKNIEVLHNLGAKKITIHPFHNLSIEENARILGQINIFSQKREMELMIENVSSAPYNSADIISKLLEKVPNAKLTLDIGHANIIFELDKFLETFKTKTGHIHLHDNIGNSDHLFFENQGKLEKMLSKIGLFGYDGTVLLETFSVIKDDQNISQEFPDIKKIHIEQLKMIPARISAEE
jgi:sugar phosphate isomerase/epimerase